MEQATHLHSADGPVIGARIRGARREAGLSNASFARAMSVGERTASRWQSGVLVPSLSRLYAIAQVLDKPVSYFVDEQAA
jgi:transcriptional regulator with XRE-family HTH domain